MRKTQTIFVVLALASVFLLSFLIGRATALRDSAEGMKDDGIYTGTIPLPESFIKDKKHENPADTPASAGAKVAEEKESKEKDTKEKEAKKNEPPTRMLFPCGNTVIKAYSETAVYSKTMDDWRSHKGIDYAAEEGTAVCAVWDGKVSKVEKNKIWGYTVEIKHSGNVYSIYKNLNRKIEVKEGQAVTKNQILGTVGSSASVESHDPPHLHFEMRQDGVTINPESYIY